jgi:hypothetical protein
MNGLLRTKIDNVGLDARENDLKIIRIKTIEWRTSLNME